MMHDQHARKVLRLTVDLPGVYADDLDELAAIWSDEEPPTDRDRLLAATEEWFRREVIVVLTTIPGEKCQNDEFEVVARTARIVGVDAVEAKS